MKEEEIVPYLPYNVRMVCTYGDEDFNYEGRIKRLTHWNCHRIDGKQWKLILHPLADLIKPYMLGSQTPIVELLKPEFNIDPKNLRIVGSTILTGEYILISTERMALKISQFQKLFEWHFDVFGLIEKGEAIDINTMVK